MAGLFDTIRDSLWPAITADDRAALEKKSNFPTPGTPAYASAFDFNRAKSGARVNVTTAIQVTAVLACVKVIAEGAAQVPCKVYQTDNGAKTPAPSHALYSLLYRRPNALQTSFEFREQMFWHALLTGDAITYKLRDARGQITDLLPILPEHARFERYADGSMRYWIRLTEKSGEVEVPARDVWHFRGPSWNGWKGLDIVQLARNAIGLAIATESFGSEMFANGVRPSGHLEVPTSVGPEVIEQIRQNWEAVHQGEGNRLKTALLAGGVTFKTGNIQADEAQYIETRKFLIEEVCRVFRVNPVMIMHQENSTSYGSVEQLLISHVTHTLSPWFRRFEQSAEVNLLTREELAAGYHVELIEQVLMRGTAADRVQVLAALRQNGAITGNEMREGMDLPRVENPVLEEYTPAAHLYGQVREEASEAAS